MNALDLFILLPIAYFAFKGFKAGIIKEVMGIAGIILAVYIAFEFMKPVSKIVEPLFSGPDTATLATGIFLFVVVVAATQFLAYTSKKFLELLKINFINRIAGGFFGIIKSGVVISAFLLLLAGFDLPGEESREDSLSYPVVITMAPVAFNVVAAVVPGADNFISTIEEAIEENNPIRSLPIFEHL